MGGELEKSTLQQKTSSKLESKSPSRNHKGKLNSIETNDIHSPTKKMHQNQPSKQQIIIIMKPKETRPKRRKKKYQ